MTIYRAGSSTGTAKLTLKPEEIAKIAKEGKGSMPKGVFKGTDEELKKLSEFVAKYNKNNKKLTTKFVVSFYFDDRKFTI